MRTILHVAALALAAIASCATPNLDDPPPPISDAPPSKHATGMTNAATGPLPTSSSASSTLPPAPSSTASSGSGGGSGGAPSGDAPVDAGPQSRRWKGTLGSTSSVDFGGGSECHYRITLQQVAVDVTAAANGDIVAASVTAVAFEQVLSNPCNNAAIPAHTHHYALTTAALLQSGLNHLELSGPSTNHPAAALVIEGDLKTANPVLTLRWHRTDFGPPLDWTVNAHVTVNQQQ